MHLRFLNPYAGPIKGIFRIVVGLLFMQHGAQKLFGALGGVGPNGGSVPLASQMGVAGVLEFFGGALIALGLFTGVVAFILSGEMAVAYFMAHMPQGFFPIQTGGELSALYAFTFLYFAASGPGAFSLDGLRSRGRPADAAGDLRAPPRTSASAGR